MRKRLVGSATLVFLLAVACAVSSEARRMPATTRSWLARFGEASRFIPPGMKSHWFAIRRVPAEGTEPAYEWLEVHAGRDFEPAWGVGCGAYVGVNVTDYGKDGIRVEDLELDVKEKRPPIGASPVWRTQEQKRRKNGEAWILEHWSALVDNRFVVAGTSEALLHQALRRDHAPSFGSLEPLPGVPPDTIHLVLRDLAGTPPLDEPQLTYFPGASVIMAYATDPPRFQFWGRDEADLRGLLRPILGKDGAMHGTALPPPQDRVALEFQRAGESDPYHQDALAAAMATFGLSLQ